MSTDVWALSPAAASAAYFRAAATHTATTLTLLQSNFAAAGALNGAGYRLTFTSNGALSCNYLITGVVVGQQSGTTTETVAGVGTGTATGAKYWARVDSIVADASSVATTVSVGFAANVAIPRARIKGVHFVAAATAGTIPFQVNSTSGITLLNIDTPAVASAAFSQMVWIPGDGIPIAHSAPSDFAICTPTQVTKFTIFLG